MKKLLILFVLLCGLQKSHAQFFKNNFYYEGEIGGIVSFAFTDNEGKTHPMTLGGLNFRGGIGVHDENEIVFFGLHSGMDGNFRHDIGILPVYINSKVGIPFTETGRIYIGFGYGKDYQIGPERRHGYLRKYTIELSGKSNNGNNNRESVFIEVNNYGFHFPDTDSPGITLNLGFKYTFM